jgi:hypothetical protein
MARIRSVHPALFTDEAWVSCSPLARILYIGLWTDADDQGLFEWKPLQIKMRLLPGDAADAPQLLAELEGVGLIVAYEADGKKLGAIRNFRKFQRPQKPNAIHPLPERISAYVGLSANSPQAVDDNSATATGNVDQMEEGRDEGLVEEPVGSSAASPDRADAAEWKLRLEEAKLVGGEGLNLTIPAMHSHRDLKALVEPTSGEPCTWLEVVDAIRIEAAKAKTRGRPIRSWTWVHETALAMRDRRLAGLPAPTAPVELSRVRPSAPSGAERRKADFVERLSDIGAAMDAAVRQAAGGSGR